jgi:hypothetical protein
VVVYVRECKWLFMFESVSGCLCLRVKWLFLFESVSGCFCLRV